MDEPTCKSEVARLRQRIRLEYEAEVRGLYGPAQGTAQHAFITKRMENIGTCHETLKGLVGEQEATRVLAAALEEAGNGGM